MFFGKFNNCFIYTFAGVTVTTLEAIDYDDPVDAKNARISYSLASINGLKNDPALTKFKVNKFSGRIYTAVCCLDRELQQNYTFYAVATDGGGKKGMIHKIYLIVP